MGLLITLVIGAIVGWLGSIVMKTNAQMGLIANIVVGIVGAAIGNWLAAQLGLVTAGVGGWVVAVVGAMIFIGLLKVLGVFS
ncbi:transglycosylase [Luteitalea sp. TBR-22]|uniref:GlsB/YeaQ/YmgE family stress response membrane protein n=1 Tax=Luteitalea sp. TBR-22 TaxID=2802971 RepID=UPI001AFC3DC6|nr:GlsB/YeaQ/YmgE family stress response membrane protein [Luteitalea sp. TBR-22]BCS35010.1 transglycosylase [Luteitalea sp. TBR-22]